MNCASRSGETGKPKISDILVSLLQNKASKLGTFFRTPASVMYQDQSVWKGHQIG